MVLAKVLTLNHNLALDRDALSGNHGRRGAAAQDPVEMMETVRGTDSAAEVAQVQVVVPA